MPSNSFDLSDYVPVHERLSQMRGEHAEWSLDAEVLVDDGTRVLVKATIRTADGNVIASGHAEEVRGEGPVNRTSAVENAETSAWGRALANAGYEVKRGIASREEMHKATRQAPGDSWTEMGWADQLEHDHARHDLLERIQLQTDDVKAEIKESVSRSGFSWARPMTRGELDTITSWLPTESPQTPPAAQDGPAPAEAGQPLPGEYPEAPEGIDHDRWTGALAIADSMRLSEIMASLAEHGLGTKGTEAERRIRLAVAIASEAQPD